MQDIGERLTGELGYDPDQVHLSGMLVLYNNMLQSLFRSQILTIGVVFLAIDERKIEARDRNPYVAVKILNDEFRRHPDSLIALQRESRRSQQLAHDNIVRVYDFDKDGTTVYMTMEFVDGEDLKNLIRSLDGKGMPMAEAFPLIEGMGRALERAHRDGVVHSDFKPGNVMLTSDRVPKVFDFGIARAGKQKSDASGEQTVFDAGSLGALTPAYASLEMLQGKDAEPADDLYALACVSYELLTGRHPFNKINAEQALKQGMTPERVPGLTKLQWRTLARGLAFKREQRIATAGDDGGWRLHVASLRREHHVHVGSGEVGNHPTDRIHVRRRRKLGVARFSESGQHPTGFDE